MMNYALEWKLEKRSQVWWNKNKHWKKKMMNYALDWKFKKKNRRFDGRKSSTEKRNWWVAYQTGNFREKKKNDDLEGRWKGTTSSFIEYKNLRTKHDKNVKSLCETTTDKLELAETIRFDRVHQLNDKPYSPRRAFYKKKCIMTEERKLKGSDVFIAGDFSSKVREVRSKRMPHLKAVKSRRREQPWLLTIDWLREERLF